MNDLLEKPAEAGSHDLISLPVPPAEAGGKDKLPYLTS